VTGDGDMSSKPGPAVDVETVRSLARLLDEMQLTEIEIEQSGLRVRVARQMMATAGYAPPSDLARSMIAPGMAGDPVQHPGVVASPMVGTAFRAPEPGARPFCDIGSVVKTGDTLLVIEAMKTLNLIPAPRPGRVVQILFDDAQPVEFGEPLMIIE
jgi:acetyl-CoA carboxylase biotin carboxyl carrier protein